MADASALSRVDLYPVVLTGAGFVINALIACIVYFFKKESESTTKRIQDLERITQDDVVRIGTFAPFRSELLNAIQRLEDRLGGRLDDVEADIADLRAVVGRLDGQLSVIRTGGSE